MNSNSTLNNLIDNSKMDMPLSQSTRENLGQIKPKFRPNKLPCQKPISHVHKMMKILKKYLTKVFVNKISHQPLIRNQLLKLVNKLRKDKIIIFTSLK